MKIVWVINLNSYVQEHWLMGKANNIRSVHFPAYHYNSYLSQIVYDTNIVESLYTFCGRKHCSQFSR